MTTLPPPLPFPADARRIFLVRLAAVKGAGAAGVGDDAAAGTAVSRQGRFSLDANVSRRGGNGWAVVVNEDCLLNLHIRLFGFTVFVCSVTSGRPPKQDVCWIDADNKRTMYEQVMVMRKNCKDDCRDGPNRDDALQLNRNII